MDANEHIKPTDGSTYTRWYDQQQTLSKSVKLLEIFPVEYQEVLGNAIIDLAANHCNAETLMANLRTLGPEKVLNIFKAKGKNRSYDQNETVHKAMNYLYVLPDESRLFIASQVIELTGHLFEYFSICRETGQAPDKETAQSLSQAFIQGQLQDTVEHLSKFHPSMNLPNGPTLKSIRAKIMQARSQSFAEELEYYKNNKPITDTTKQPASIFPIQSLSSQTTSTQSGEPETISKTETAEEPPSAAKPLALKSETGKDETLAQDNRGMKIRLDKFDL